MTGNKTIYFLILNTVIYVTVFLLMGSSVALVINLSTWILYDELVYDLFDNKLLSYNFGTTHQFISTIVLHMIIGTVAFCNNMPI